MALRFLKSMFTKSGRAPSPARRLEPDEAVVFIAAVDRAYAMQPDRNFASDQASMRLRVGIPARELSRHARVWLAPVDHVSRDPGLAAFGKVGAVVVGKLPVRFFTGDTAAAERLIGWIEASARKRRVVVDFSDDLAAAAAMYSVPALAQIQKRLLSACAATVPTQALRERLARDARHGVTVIEDPYESLRAGTPRFSPGETLRLVWFGVFGPPLRPYIERALAAVARRLGGRAIELTFVTYADQAALVTELASTLHEANPHCAVRHVAWSVPATAAALAQADLVVLPQDASSDWARAKSHNRLVESIRAGRFAIVSPVPAYMELERYAWVGEDLAGGVAWALSHPSDVLARIAEGQQYVSERFSPQVIGTRWAEVLGVAADQPLSFAS